MMPCIVGVNPFSPPCPRVRAQFEAAARDRGAMSRVTDRGRGIGVALSWIFWQEGR